MTEVGPGLKTEFLSKNKKIEKFELSYISIYVLSLKYRLKLYILRKVSKLQLVAFFLTFHP